MSLAPSTPKNPGYKFPTGHPRFGGRQKGTLNKRTKFAQDLAAELKVDPVRFMLMLLNSDTVEVPVLKNPLTGEVEVGPDGKPLMRQINVPLDLRLDAAKAVAPYVHPRLQATQITGQGDGPVQLDVDVAGVLADPQAAKAAQELALKLAQGRTTKPGE